MSPTFKIPKTLAESGFVGRQDFDWCPDDAETTWLGTLEVVRVQDVQASDSNGFLVPKGAQQAEVASLQIGQIAPAEENLPDPGNQKFFDERIVLSVDGVDFTEADEPWQLQRAQSHLGNLAFALGMTDDYEEDGESYIVPAENFAEMFRASDGNGGGLSGQRVMFRVAKRRFARRTDKPGEQTGVEYQIRGFTQAV